jgi:hypothetical protein
VIASAELSRPRGHKRGPRRARRPRQELSRSIERCS